MLHLLERSAKFDINKLSTLSIFKNLKFIFLIFLSLTTKADTKKTIPGSSALKSRLKLASYGTTTTPAGPSEEQSELESEELNELMKEIDDTTIFILHKVKEHEMNEQSSSSSNQTSSILEAVVDNGNEAGRDSEQFYVDCMSELQFGTFLLFVIYFLFDSKAL